MSLGEILIQIGQDKEKKRLYNGEISDTEAEYRLPTLSQLCTMSQIEFVKIFPEPTTRNQIKVFLRKITNTPLKCDSLPQIVPISSLTDLPPQEEINKIVEKIKKLWIQVLHIPELFENTTNVTINKWNIKLLQPFRSGDELCDLSTSIADVVFEAPDDGYISEFIFLDGSEVHIDSSIAVMVHTRKGNDTENTINTF